MNRKTFLSTVIGLLATFCVIGGSIGVIGTAEANSNGGLAGSAFEVNVEVLAVTPGFGLPFEEGDKFENCYTFEDADNVWIDPTFLDPETLVPGFWVQHTGGFIIRYTAFADASEFAPVQLIQNGTVTPTFRRGKRRLTAYSTLIIVGVNAAEFLSKGRSVDSCD